MQKIISIKDGVTRMPEWRMAEPVNFESCEGEHIAIVGPMVVESRCLLTSLSADTLC